MGSKKHALKVVEPSLQDQLDVAIAAEASARASLQKAEVAFAAKFPGGVRAYGPGGVSRFEEQAPLPKGISQDLADQLTAERQSIQRRDFPGDWDELCQLRITAEHAGRKVSALRVRVQEDIDEPEARERLAAAIKTAENASAEVERRRAAASRADAAVSEAAIRHADASRAVASATEAQAKTYEAAIEQGHAPAWDDSIRDARRELDVAAEALAIARTAAPGIKAKLTAAEDNLREARKEVSKWAGWVASTAIPRLLAEAERIRVDLEGRRQVLAFLSCIASTEHDQAVDAYLQKTVFPFGLDGETPQEHPACGPWVAAIAKMASDATAPIPEA